jgi:small subunit ribosomal protein S3
LGRKVHPLSFRIGGIRDWQARWYADKHYADFLQEDFKLRKAIQSRYAEAGVSLVEIERQSNEVSITIHTARPGIVIGRGGQRVDETRLYLEKLIGKRVRLNIREIHQPELDAYLVARALADQIERRIAYRRAMKQAMFRTMQAGAKGIKINCAGRLGGVEIARRQMMHQGQVPLHTLRADIDYGFTEAHTTLGQIGVKVWIYKGDILPEAKEVEIEEMPAEVASDIIETELSAATELVEKPTEPAVDKSVEVAPAMKTEEKLTKPAVRRSTKAAPSPKPKVDEVEETPAKPVADVSAEAELSTEQGESNVTTETGETPQGS